MYELIQTHCHHSPCIEKKKWRREMGVLWARGCNISQTWELRFRLIRMSVLWKHLSTLDLPMRNSTLLLPAPYLELSQEGWKRCSEFSLIQYSIWIYFLLKLTCIKWICMTACQASSPLANQIYYLPMARCPLSEIYHMASTDMDGCALNSLGTRIIIAVKVHQSQKKHFLLACFSALTCLMQGRQGRVPPFTRWSGCPAPSQ